MKRDIFISKADVAYGAGLTLDTDGFWTADAMTLGSIAIFNEDQSVVDGTAGVVAGDITGDYIYIGAMTNAGMKFSVPIPRSTFKYTKKAYVAPVAAVKVLGATADASYGSLNLPSSLSVGDTVAVAIIDRTKEHWDTSRVHLYNFAVTSGDLLTGTTSANIIAKLVALINADSNRVVTAAVLDDGADADGISFTARIAGNDFDIVIMDGVLKDADVLEYKSLNRTYTAALTNTVVANNPGQGTYAQVVAAELESNIGDGYHNTLIQNKYEWLVTSNAASAGTYTTYSINFTPPTDSPLSKEVGFKQSIQIFVPSGETGVGEAITALDEIFALVNP